MARSKADPIIQELYLLRKCVGMNITEVAELAGVNRTTISTAELGHKSPNLATVRRWAEGLGLELVLREREDEETSDD